MKEMQFLFSCLAPKEQLIHKPMLAKEKKSYEDA